MWGKIPARKHFDKSLTLKEYRERSKIYTPTQATTFVVACVAKKECLLYLAKDLKSLENVMKEFNKIIYETFKVNPAKTVSYSGLAKKIYLVKYYKKKYQIPVITGFVDGFIRLGYIGGIVDVVKHVIFKSYKYDVNSAITPCVYA
jgi:hypothetical protein